jgi:OOP family OmpA-OmpF porin
LKKIFNTYQKHFLFLVFVLGFSFCGILKASNSDSTKSICNELKQKAKSSYRSGDVYTAIYYYRDYLKLNPADTKSMYILASLYFETRDYKNAADCFDSVLMQKPGKYPLSLYYRGMVLMNLEQYDLATKCFEQFRKVYRGAKDPEQYRRRSQIQIDNAAWAKNHIDSVSNITIKHLDATINQPHIEFSPFLKDENTLIYGSLRDGNSDGEMYRKIYQAVRNGDEWIYESRFDNKIDEGNFHSGNAVISTDGKRMYFTRTETNWQGKMICSIYKSEFVNNEWQEPQKLPYPINDENYTSTQPALGNNLRSNSDILYFVSDRPGGRGGLDIWFSEPDRQTGEFKEPRNLGRTINTYEDDCSPFYDVANRTLYFSSKGHEGFGGFDIFKSIGSGKQWTDVQSLPQPVNSSYDDTYFTTISGKEGFFTSNRPGAFNLDNGSCCDDIFFYRFNECHKAGVAGKVVNSTNYDFFDDLNERYHLDIPYPEDNIPLSGVPVFAYTADSANKDILVAQTKTNTNGTFNLNLDMGKDYSVVVKNYGYFDKKLRVSTKAIDCTDTISLGITSINYIPAITVRVNVYYEHDKSRLTPEAMKTMDTAFLPFFDLLPNAIIEIGSHTDSTGSDSYNMKLSQRRSESVVHYLVDKGISIDRLVAKGYGESMPLVPNSNPDGTDNPANRQLNRRTELRIVGEISSFYFEE